MASRRRVPVVRVGSAAVAVLIFGASACSDQVDRPPSASEAFAQRPVTAIFNTALDAMADVTSFRVRASYTLAGSVQRIDFRGDGHGNCAGTLTIKGEVAAMVSTPVAMYFRADPAFWVAMSEPLPAAALAALGHRWVKQGPDAGMQSLCNFPQRLADQTRRPAGSGDQEVQVGRRTNLDGEKVVELTGPGNDFLVEARAPHRIVEARGHDGSGTQTFQFSDFGAPVTVHVPQPSEYVSRRELVRIALSQTP